MDVVVDVETLKSSGQPRALRNSCDISKKTVTCVLRSAFQSDCCRTPIEMQSHRIGVAFKISFESISPQIWRDLQWEMQIEF